MAVKSKLLILLALLFIVSCSSAPVQQDEVSLEKELEEIINTLDQKIKKEPPMQEVKQEELKVGVKQENMIVDEKVEDLPLKLEIPEKVVKEGELVSFPNLKATDPDGDVIKYTFTNPLNEKGEWQTKAGDAGEYKVKISASDGKNTVVQEVVIKVLSTNKPPVIKLEKKELFVKEGETVVLKFEASDPENSNVSVSISGWMSQQSYTTTYSDAGTHKVKISASDGKQTVTEEVTVIVSDVNRPPVFVAGSFK